jgi:hypothetical protein
MSDPAVEPLSARLSWEEVHRLELLVRLRASSLTQSARSRHRCPVCASPLGAAAMRLGGILVHPGCLSDPGPLGAHPERVGPPADVGPPA